MTVNGRLHLAVPYTLSANDAKCGRGLFAMADNVYRDARDSVDGLYSERIRPSSMLALTA